MWCLYFEYLFHISLYIFFTTADDISEKPLHGDWEYLKPTFSLYPIFSRDVDPALDISHRLPQQRPHC